MIKDLSAHEVRGVFDFRKDGDVVCAEAIWGTYTSPFTQDGTYPRGEPLISEYTADGDKYLFVWCDGEGDTNRWVVYDVTDEQLKTVRGEPTVRELQVMFSGNPYVLVIDFDITGCPIHSYLLPTSALPQGYVVCDKLVTALSVCR